MIPNDTPPSTRESMRQLAIVERYETFLHYIYPIFMGIPRAHYILRDRALDAALDQPRLFIDAGKSPQISKLYLADAGLAHLRSILRFCAHPGRKLISRQQHETASVHLAETGRMLGAWIRGQQGRAKGEGG